MSLVTMHLAMIYLAMKRVENRNLTNPEEIEKALRLGNYIKKGAWLSSRSYVVTCSWSIQKLLRCTR